MKLTAIIIICLLWVSCKKESASGNQLVGTYKGGATYSPSDLASLDDVAIVNSSGTGNFIIKEKANRLTLTATIIGDSITIPDQNVSIGSGTFLYGSGSIMCDTLGITLTRGGSPSVGGSNIYLWGVKQ